MTNPAELNRERAKKKAEEDSLRNDLQQHANKLIQGFEKLEESHAKRAIWELCQNAIDLSDHCKIRIEEGESFFKFSHNGKPFDSNTLDCLIKQVSSKTSENNLDQVGQYGTGFITTHSFGKRFLLDGSLQVEEVYIALDSFEIDRKAKDADELIKKLIEQKKKVIDLIGQGQAFQEQEGWTTFSYQIESALERENVQKTFAALPDLLPYVMVLNSKLHEVEVKQKNGSKTIYRKGNTRNEAGVYRTDILLNEKPLNIYYLKSEEEGIIVILPLREKDSTMIFGTNISRLFLFYPLIGTEQFGFNYIVHSSNFSPTEPRDGIHLKSKNEQIEAKEYQNRKLLEKASEMIFAYVKRFGCDVKDPLNLATIDFKMDSAPKLLIEYLAGLTKKWTDQFLQFPLVETNTVRLAPADTLFLDRKLLCDREYLPAIYAIVNKFWQDIPKKSVVMEWTEVTRTWGGDSIKYISVEMVAEKIQNEGKLSCFDQPEDLKQFYEYLVKHEYHQVFTDYSLLPNIKQDLRTVPTLKSSQNIESALIEIADVLIPEVPRKYIDEAFKYDLNLEPYDRKQFSKDLNAQITKLSPEITVTSLLPDDQRNALIQYCMIFPSLEKMGTRGQLMPLICEYYGIEQVLNEMPGIADQELDWYTPLKCLVRNFVFDISGQNTEWIEGNREFLGKTIPLIASYSVLKELIQNLPLFPNQLGVFCKPGELEIDQDIPEKLIDLFDKIVGGTKELRSELADKDFSVYLDHQRGKAPREIAADIESKFTEGNISLENINDHPFRKNILNIIQEISNNAEWGKYFPVINEKKATIMMARISDEKTKSDLFSIIGLDRKQIALLGELSRKSDMERIIELGQKVIEDENEKKADFQFKHDIGTHLEKLIREKISTEMRDLKVEVQEQQGGQDLILKLEQKIVYRIEIKSRWQTSTSITMSPSQMKQSVQFKDAFSLCSVDMTDYRNGEENRFQVGHIDEILDRIKVIMDIGERITPLVSQMPGLNSGTDEITIGGDFHAIIPQSVVSQGVSFNELVDVLLKKLI